ncbi:MAG: UDP-glucose 6-dehydrogenase [Candidatus Staskawiczbacteria bacterium RIFCSPHIGHO2_02_FULL_34_9]|uniref:UDP-glucose 6-dehydrogenase n=1 Tax=Candidatus Staskawiczbacteria bacterium RIFCSPHIGHO2_02_FULL_34_9 TaxID=1802206 RepID=A0A1G2I3H6_9BACT|nr:MAG: UDP-glucose 6-dehydrogenase [Candidatus Staskawiczbacteria bacterium RIFCSPHIGHO2_02_FULL_34_9]
MNKIKICIIGTGYVGLVTGVCLAEIGHSVICIDNNKEKINKLKRGVSPIFEPGLSDLIKKNIKKGGLLFSEDIDYGVKNSNVIFICVNTPTQKNGKTDLRYIQTVAKEVARAMDTYKVIVSKSTMPVGTSQKIKEIMKRLHNPKVTFDIVSNPEFLREGTAIKDFLKPDRIVMGTETEKAKKIMASIYKPIKAPIIFTGIEASEIIKHACNSFLATKISFINAVANICEKNGGEIEEVAMAMGLDERIGKSFLRAGIGFGGSCFPKDVAAFTRVAKDSGYDFKLLKEVQKINWRQREQFVKKVESVIPNLKGKKIGVLGLSFKPDTDDMREAPSIDIIKYLLAKGATIKAYDPVAMEKAEHIFHNSISYSNNMYEVMKDSDALLILTEWSQFLKIDFQKAKKLLKSPIIVDGRNMFNPEKMGKMGFVYYSVGRKTS